MFKGMVDNSVTELEIMFKSLNGSVTVEENIETKKSLITCRTKEMILDSHKEKSYLYGALLNCRNYSIKAENDEIIIVLGFEWR